MQFSITYASFVVFVCSFAHVQGLDVLKTLLNNGKSHYCVDRWDNCCTTTEWNFITQKVYTMGANQRRGLRGNETTTIATDLSDSMILQEINDTAIDERQLQTYPKQCARLCEGFLPGRCLANKCVGYRRSLIESITSMVKGSSSSNTDDERALYWATSCSNQQSEMNNLLTNIKWNVGPRCRSLLEAPRQFSCLYNVVC